MKTYISFLITGLVFFSCEKEPDKELPGEHGYAAGELSVRFVNNTTLKSAFSLVNKFDLEIIYAGEIWYSSKLPADSLDYVMNMLKARSYLNDDRWHSIGEEFVYVDENTGIITLSITLMNMDEARQNDWGLTAILLKLEEQPSAKSFILRVPAGEETYWRNTLRQEYMVSNSDLVYIITHM